MFQITQVRTSFYCDAAAVAYAKINKKQMIVLTYKVIASYEVWTNCEWA
jgi:hypothetical protein